MVRSERSTPPPIKIAYQIWDCKLSKLQTFRPALQMTARILVRCWMSIFHFLFS
jgi:hypothetical protein